MRTIFTLLWSSLLACSVVAQTPRPAADTCLTRYRLSRAEVSNCDIQERTSPYIIEMVLLGKSLTDGFQFNWRPNQINGYFATTLFAYNGTTTPIPGVFQACPGNWVYFKGRGFRKSVQNANTVVQYQDVSFRVRYWGSIQKPDSLKMEYKSEPIQGAYVTIRRDSICDKCLATDKTPPQITGCPSATVELPMPADPTKVNGNEVMKQVGIKVTDNCSIYNATNYPYSTSVTNGQTIDYKTVVYDPSGNRSVCRFKVQFASPLADTCLAYFKMERASLEHCKQVRADAPFRYDIQLLGKQIKEGFIFKVHPNLINGRNGTYITGKKGTPIPPAGISFNDCAGNWVYFKATGFRQQLFVNPDAVELDTLFLRIRHFGKERNPDSLWIEFSKPMYGTYFVSSRKDTICDKCLATDKTPPNISNCPTGVISYPVQPRVTSSDVVRHAGIVVSDNCERNSSLTYPYKLDTPSIGQIVDYKLVAYDQTANKSVCNFKVQFVAPVPATQPSAVITPLNAMVYEQKVKLDWAQSADSVAHIEVQKLKTDGSGFETIHPSIAQPSENRQVGYDELPVEGANDYRLKTILKNGKIGYSPTQRVDYQKLRDFTIFPNPTDGIAFLDLKAFENLKVEISISDVAGKVLSKQIIENASVLPHRLDVSKLEKGTYFVQIQTVGKQAVTRPLQVIAH
jgi:Secretion system C-terminal sorting domain